jgi:hypothetical protein
MLGLDFYVYLFGSGLIVAEYHKECIYSILVNTIPDISMGLQYRRVS